MAICFLAAYAWPILDPALSSTLTTTCRAVTWGSWAIFVVDYVVRLALARGHRRRFLRSSLPDLAAVVLPLLRLLRLLRLVRVLSVLNRTGSRSLRGRVLTYVIGSGLLAIFVASLAVLDAERGRRGANIESFGDAVWWSLATMSTVGYGDRFPVTITGRAVAVGLMLAGIALLGVVTASFATWLIERVTEAEDEAQVATTRDIAALTAEIAALRAQLDQRAP